MATQATVSLVVDETGAVAGLTRFQQRAMASFQGAKTQTVGLNEAILKLTAAIEGMGAAGKRGTDAISNGMQKATGHALTNLDSVRLLRDDLGVHIPRAMEKLISSTQAFQQIASVAFGGFAFIGVVELLGAIGGKLDGVMHSLMGDTKAVQDLRKALEETNELEIINPKNTGVARDSVNTLNEDITFLGKKMSQVQGAIQIARDTAPVQNKDANLLRLAADIKNTRTSEEEARLAKDEADRPKVLKAQADLGDKLNQEDLRQQRENAAIGLEGYRKIAQDTANAKAEIDDKVNGTHGQAKSLTPDEGNRAKRDLDAKAAAQYRALNVEYADEVRDAWQKSAVSMLQGEERAYAEMAVAVQNYTEKAERAGVSETQMAQVQTSMWNAYLNEKQQRQQQFTDETLRMADRVRVAQSTGTQRMLAEETSALDDLTRERAASGRLSVEYDQEYEDRRKQIHANTEAQIAQSVKTYGDGERAMRDELSASASRGYTQIEAEKTRRDDEALKKYEDLAKGLKATDQAYVDATAIYQRELQDIDNETEQKKKELHQRNADEIANIEDQAQSVRIGSRQKGLFGIFAEEQQQTARISAEYNKRVREAQATDDGTVQNHAAAVAKIQAAEDLRDAQMEQSSRDMNEKLAGSLESALRDPLGAIKDQMQHMMAEIVANWLMQLTFFKSAYAAIMGHLPGAPGGTSSSGGLGSIMTGSAPWSHASVGGGGVTSQGGGIGVGSTIPGSGGMVMTPNGPVPAFDPNSPAYHHFVGNGAPGSTAGSPGGVGGSAPRTSGGLPPNTWPGSGGSGSGSSSQAAVGGVGKAAAVGYAGYSGYEDTVAAYKSGSAGGILKGAMGDAMAGAVIGSLFGPAGTLIGAGIGATVGLVAGGIGAALGEGGRLSARDYYKKSILPALESDRNNNSGGDFQTQVSDVNRKATDGMTYMRGHWGSAAADWVNQNYLLKEQRSVLSQIEGRARGGSQYVSMSASQFHSGGAVNGFGDLATSSNEGFIHAMLGEAVVNPPAYSAHRPAVDAMNAGASPETIAAMYQRPSDSSGGQTSGDVHLHVHTLDTRTTESWLRNTGARVIAKHLNGLNSRYAGDGISG